MQFEKYSDIISDMNLKYTWNIFTTNNKNQQSTEKRVKGEKHRSLYYQDKCGLK